MERYIWVKLKNGDILDFDKYCTSYAISTTNACVYFRHDFSEDRDDKRLYLATIPLENIMYICHGLCE